MSTDGETGGRLQREVGDGTEPDARRPASIGLLVVLLGLAISAVAFVALDVVLAAFVASFALTAAVIGAFTLSGRPTPSFEEREAARARKRKAKWDAAQPARDKDRARWEAHQARKSRRAD